MEVAGWILDKSEATRAEEPAMHPAIAELAGLLFLCPIGELEQLYSARSARDCDALKEDLRASFEIVPPPPDIFDRALRLQQDFAIITGCGTEQRFPIRSPVAASCLVITHSSGTATFLRESSTDIGKQITLTFDAAGS